MRSNLAILALALLLLAACGGSDSPSSPTLATMRGRLHVIGSSTTIAGGTLTVQGTSGVSGPDGSFSIAGLQPGLTNVSVSAPRFFSNTIGVTLVAGDNFFSIAMEPVP
jgi:hypothetical protein